MTVVSIQEKIHHGNYRKTRIGVLPELNHANVAEFMSNSPYRGSGFSEGQVEAVLNELTHHAAAEIGWATYTALHIPEDATCEWYAMCNNPAVAVASTLVVDHPVPVCQRCVGLFTVDDRARLQVTMFSTPPKEETGSVNIEPKFTLVRAWNGDVVKIDPPYEPGLTRNVWAVHDADKECGHVHIDPDCDDCTREFTVTPGPYSGNDDILYYLLTKETWTDADKDIKYVF